MPAVAVALGSKKHHGCMEVVLHDYYYLSLFLLIARLRISLWSLLGGFVLVHKRPIVELVQHGTQQGWGHVGMGSFEHLVQRPLLLLLPRPLSLLATATALLCYCYCDHDCTHCHCYCYHGCPVTAATRGAGRPLLLQWAQQTIVLSKRVRKREIEREREREREMNREGWSNGKNGSREPD